MKPLERYNCEPDELAAAITNATSADDRTRAIVNAADLLAGYPPMFTALTLAHLPNEADRKVLTELLIVRVDQDTYRYYTNIEQFERVGGRQVFRAVLLDNEKQRKSILHYFIKRPSNARSGSPGVPHGVVIATHKGKEIIRAARGAWLRMEGK